MTFLKRFFNWLLGRSDGTPASIGGPPKTVVPIMTLDIAEQRATDYANSYFNQGSDPALWIAAQRGYKTGIVFGYSYAEERRITGNT